MNSVENIKHFGRLIGDSANQLLTDVRSRFDGVVMPLALAEDVDNISSVRSLQRNALIARVISTITGLVVTFGISYYGIRWLVSAMDPTKHEKKEERQKVVTFIIIIIIGIALSLSLSPSAFSHCILASVLIHKPLYRQTSLSCVI